MKTTSTDAKYTQVDDDEESGDIELQDIDPTCEIKVLNVGTQTSKTVEVKAGGVVRDLMEAIEQAFEEAPVQRQRLIASGRVLQADDTLASHKLEGSEVRTVHLSMRPDDAAASSSPAASSAETTVVNPLASVDALSAALALDPVPPGEARARADSTVRAAARVRLLSSLLALYCALNSLTALLDATTVDPSANAPDQHAVVELALNVGGLWVGGAGLRASRHLDLPSAERYDRSLRIFAVTFLSYEAYYRIVFLPNTVNDDDDEDPDLDDDPDSDNPGVLGPANTTEHQSHPVHDDYRAVASFGDDDLGAGTGASSDTDDITLSHDSQMLSGFVTLMLMSAIWLVCVNNSARLRAELRGLPAPSDDAALPSFAPATTTLYRRSKRKVHQLIERSMDDIVSSSLAVEEEEDVGLEIERAAARARTSTLVVMEQLAAASVPEAEWVEYFTERGNAYYYNEATGESRWELPTPETLGLRLRLRAELADDANFAIVPVTDDADDALGVEATVDEDAAAAEVEPLRIEEETQQHSSNTHKSRAVVRRESADDAERELAAREGREACVSLTARGFVHQMLEEFVDSHVAKWVLMRREKARETQRALRIASHAAYRVNKAMIAQGEEEEEDEEVLRQERRQRVAEETARQQRAREEEAQAAARREIAARDTGLDAAGNGDETASCVERALAAATSRLVRRVALVECDLGDDDMGRVAEALSSSAVTHLELGRNRITSVGVRTLAGTTCVSLRDLHVNNNAVGDDGVAAICESFLGFADDKEKASLRALNLVGNPVSADGTKRLARALLVRRCELATLRLGGACASKAAFKPRGKAEYALREIVPGNRGAALLAAALLAPASGFGNRPQALLTSLCVAHCGIGVDGARALAAALYCEPPVTRIDVTGNPLEGPGVGAPLVARRTHPNRLPPPLAADDSAKIVPDGGVAALALALEATSTVSSVVKADDVATQAYLLSLARRPPPKFWRRQRALGAEACASREWLLDVAGMLGLSMPARGEQRAVARLELLAAPFVSSSEQQKNAWWTELTARIAAVWPPSEHRDELGRFEDFALTGELPPRGATWHELVRAKLVLEVVLENRRQAVVAAEAAASALEARAAEARDANAERRRRRRPATPEDRGASVAAAAARRAVREAQDEIDRRRGQIARATVRQATLARTAASLVADTDRFAAASADEAMRAETTSTDAVARKRRAATRAAAWLASSAKTRLATLKAARALTKERGAELRDALTEAFESERKALNDLKAATAERERRTRLERDASCETSVRAAETRAAEAARDVKSEKSRMERLEGFIDHLDAAATERAPLSLRRELVPAPTGCKAIDDALANERAESLRCRAELAVAEAQLASSSEERGLLVAARVAAAARCADADRRVEEAQCDATAIRLATQPVVTETLRDHDKNLVRAIKPNGDALAVAFSATTVRALVARERARREALESQLLLMAEHKRRRREARRELRDLRRLSPRTQFETVRKRIHEIRKDGYPTTEAGVKLLAKLRGFKAKAKEALKKQRNVDGQRALPCGGGDGGGGDIAEFSGVERPASDVDHVLHPEEEAEVGAVIAPASITLLPEVDAAPDQQ
ncbi:hypothetical protein CTAYLR_001255 [Chrysophaeum taylorii]|uniref:WW domain-containing protein n=1 Tax=Chrysophaeum taylorii TaxID=2483200 RepID=A0AAD7UDD3_9STRA|nr:hypothetical protein CTAYLR_001255 [Chrysophaeum taylorii]